MEETRTEPARLRRIRLALLAGALAQFALLYMPQPLLPQLAGFFRVTPGVVALLVSAATLGLALGAIPLGTLSEAVGRRTVMVTSLLVAEVVSVIVPWIGNFALMVGLRFVQGAAVAGVAAVAVAYLAEETAGSQLGATMGLYIAGTTIGGMSGRVLGGVAGDFTGWQGGMLAITILAGVCTVSFVLLLPAERRHVRQPLSWRPLLAGLRTASRQPVLYGPFLVAALGMGSFVAVYNVLGFRLISAPFHVSPALAALAFLAYAAGTFSSALAGRLADRWGRPVVLLGSLATTGAGLGLMTIDQLSVIITGLVVFTGGFFGAHSVASGWVGARAPQSARGQASALYQFSYYAGSSVGGVAGGLAYAAWGWSGMTYLLASWLLAAAIAVVVVAQKPASDNAEPKLHQVASES